MKLLFSITSLLVLLSAMAASSQSLPIVVFDLGHHNLIAENPARVEAVAAFLTERGYFVRRSASAFDSSILREAEVLLIINARAERNIKDWSLPTPSAFTPEEVATIHRWVEGGGGLLLVVEHMPFAGAAADLASSFGVTVTNGFVVDNSKLQADNKLLPHGGVITFERAKAL